MNDDNKMISRIGVYNKKGLTLSKDIKLPLSNIRPPGTNYEGKAESEIFNSIGKVIVKDIMKILEK